MVHLEGAVECTTPANGCGNGNLATLPVGSRPNHQLLFPIFTNGGKTAALAVEPDGKIVVFEQVPDTPNIEASSSLEGITFRAVQ